MLISIDLDGLREYIVSDADILAALKDICDKIKKKGIKPKMDFMSFLTAMASLDSNFFSNSNATYTYKGTDYPELNGIKITGSDLNYIGVGAGFAAKGWSSSGANNGVRAWKAYEYKNLLPGKNVFLATKLGYREYKMCICGIKK